MSNRIRNTRSTLFVPKNQWKALYKALREIPLPRDGWVTPNSVARALDIVALLSIWGHTPKFDREGNLTALYVDWVGYYEASMSTLYKTLGPFVRKGSVQEFSDEYGNHWRWRFDGTNAIRQTGEVTYKDTNTP